MDFHSMMQEHIRNNPPVFIHGYGQLSPIERLAIANRPRPVLKRTPPKSQ